MATAVKKHIGLALPDSYNAETVLRSERFMMRRVNAVCRGGIHVISVYCHTVVGIDVSGYCNGD